MYEIYKIEFGDTLDSIADKTGTTVDNLREINKVIDINAGKLIIVPAVNSNMFGIYTVKKGDNPFSVAQEYDMNVKDLLMMNGLEKDDYIYPGQQLIVPNRDMTVYITKQGDTLDMVVDNFKADLEDIVNQNNKIYLLPEQLIVYRRG